MQLTRTTDSKMGWHGLPKGQVVDPSPERKRRDDPNRARQEAAQATESDTVDHIRQRGSGRRPRRPLEGERDTYVIGGMVALAEP